MTAGRRLTAVVATAYPGVCRGRIEVTGAQLAVDPVRRTQAMARPWVSP
jgi:hypothetical protein